jgi:excisionase family DNA binding protein
MKTAGSFVELSKEGRPALPAWPERIKALLGAFIDVAAEELAARPSTASLAEPTLQPKELAELLKIPESTVLELARRGEIPYLRIGKHVRFDRAQVAEALARKSG